MWGLGLTVLDSRVKVYKPRLGPRACTCFRERQRAVESNVGMYIKMFS